MYGKTDDLTASLDVGARAGRMARRALLASLLAGAGLLASMWPPTSPAQAGRPAPQPPPPPPVKFQLTLIHTPVRQLYDMNDSGELVGDFVDAGGRRHACIVTGGQVVDLESLVAPPDGWYLATAFGMNDPGTIVGALGQVGTPITDVRRGFVLHRPTNGPAVLNELPDGAWDYTFALDINEDGTVLGMFDAGDTNGAYVFDSEGPPDAAPFVLPVSSYGWNFSLNNSTPTKPAQVTGNLTTNQAFRYTLGDAQAEVFSFGQAGVHGISDSGALCGGAVNTAKKGPTFIAFRYDTVYQTFNTNAWADRINVAGDMAIRGYASRGAQLYSEGRGVLEINDLLIGDPGDVALFRTTSGMEFVGITERGVNPNVPGFPGLGGYINVANGPNFAYAFVLTPVAP